MISFSYGVSWQLSTWIRKLSLEDVIGECETRIYKRLLIEKIVSSCFFQVCTDDRWMRFGLYSNSFNITTPLLVASGVFLF